MRWTISFAAAVALSPLIAGCGDWGTTTTSLPVETIEKSPDLPKGWTEHANKAVGFTIGVPPGWSVEDHGVRTELLSPEHLAAVSVTVDRTDEVLDVPLEELASATVSAGVPGLRQVKPGEPRPFEHRYDAVLLGATGVGGDKNVHERLQLAVLRREGIATFTVLAAENAKNHPHFYDKQIKQIIRSVRSRPITPP